MTRPMGRHVGAEDRFSPLGHMCQEVNGSYRGPKRFIYDADVQDVVDRLRAQFPGVSQRDTDAELEVVARFFIYKFGPDVTKVAAHAALDLCYTPKRA